MQKIKFTVVTFVTFFILIGSMTNLHAKKLLKKGEIIEGQYIIVFKKENFSNVSKQNKFGESSAALSNRLIRKARQEQVLFDVQKNIKRTLKQVNAANKVNFVYKHAIQGMSAALTIEAVTLLKEDPSVDYIEPVAVVTIDAVQSSPPSWGLDRIDQKDLPLNQSYQYTYDGTGVHAYILDTGARLTHSEYSNRIQAGYDFVNNDSDPTDCNGHGTHVAGIIGGTTYGVSKNVFLHPVRVLGCTGRGTTDNVIRGIDWIRANFQSPAVANMSLGQGASQAIDDAVNNAINAGVFFVAAAGNENQDACNISPARVNDVITVAASNSNDSKRASSNTGSCVDIFAPGGDIKSSWSSSNTSSKTISGTSMAAPHVAGVIAQYLQKKPTASLFEINKILTTNSSCNKLSGVGGATPNRLLSNNLNSSISGIIDIGAVIKNAYGNWDGAGDRIRIIDYNADGRDDILIGPAGDGKWYALKNNGNSFSDVGAVISGAYGNWGSAGSRIKVIDYNTDGRDDIMLGPDGYGNWYALKNTTGSFSNMGSVISNAYGNWGGAGDRIRVTDYDADGRDDIMLGPDANGYWYGLNNTGYNFVDRGVAICGEYGNWNGSRTKVIDNNTDGKNDILLGPDSNGSWYILQYN